MAPMPGSEGGRRPPKYKVLSIGLSMRVDRDRQKVIDRYAATLSDSHDGARGKEIFGKYCRSCHRVDGVGE
jgi:mono/diheme cytochrome c family protein